MNNRKEILTKILKGMIDIIILTLLQAQPMHGYQLITIIRKKFGVYCGPSTIYPLLKSLEKKGYLIARWDMSQERPRKVYELTTEGQHLLNCAEDSFNIICRQMGIRKEPEVIVNM